jgi:uncharacterized protein (DUF2132 family)
MDKNTLFSIYYLYKMTASKQTDPLHGKTLEMIVSFLANHYGWEELGRQIRINCFLDNPSIQSSLKFLRKTPWARAKVEQLYIKSFENLTSI